MFSVKQVLFVFLCLCCLFLSAQAKERKLLIVGEAWPPFEFEENGEVIGIDVDIVKYIMKKMRIDVEMRLMTWSRAWAMVENGQADAVFSTSRKEERKPFLYYPQEDMWTSEFVFFTQRDNKLPHLQSYDEVKDKALRIGVVRGNSYNTDFWQAFPRTASGKHHPLLQPARSAEVNFKKLARGRIDLYILDKTVGLYMVRQMKLQQEIDFYDTALFAKGYPMPFVKKSDYPQLAAIAEQFEQELKAFKSSEEYHKIREKWLK